MILDKKLLDFADAVIKTVSGDCGMPLGVEPSQAEMIAFPSKLDNFLKCQLRLHAAGHYMDDYYILLPPQINPLAILDAVIEKARELDLIVNRSKCQIKALTKHFRYCKIQFFINDNGRVVSKGSPNSAKRARKKLKSFREYILTNSITYLDLWTSINSVYAYLKIYNNHNTILKLRRLFYLLFGFSSEKFSLFKYNYCASKAA